MSASKKGQQKRPKTKKKLVWRVYWVFFWICSLWFLVLWPWDQGGRWARKLDTMTGQWSGLLPNINNHIFLCPPRPKAQHFRKPILEASVGERHSAMMWQWWMTGWQGGAIFIWENKGRLMRCPPMVSTILWTTNALSEFSVWALLSLTKLWWFGSTGFKKILFNIDIISHDFSWLIREHINSF